jgi:TPR repeat protein
MFLDDEDGQAMKKMLSTAVDCISIAKKLFDADPVVEAEFAEAIQSLQKKILDAQVKIETCLQSSQGYAAFQPSNHPFTSAVQTHPACSMVNRAFRDEVAAHPLYYLAAVRSFARCEAILGRRTPPQACAQWQYIIDIASKQRRALIATSALCTALVIKMTHYQGGRYARARPLSLIKCVISRRLFLVSNEQANLFFEEGKWLYDEQRYSDAAQLWAQAALLKHGPSHAFLSNMLIQSRQGVVKDVNRAFELAASGASMGCHHSKGTLGTCYLGGFGVAQDARKALSLGKASAAKGSCFGLYVVASCYMDGRGGVARNDTLAADLFHLAAAQEHADAFINLAHMFGRGRVKKRKFRGIAEDKAASFELYSLAAAQGHPVGYFNVAVMFFRGEGVEQDYAEAAKFYRLAAAAGDASSLYELAGMFLSGQGVVQDDAVAARLFQLAAEQGHAGALCELGNLYHRGRGVAQDDVEAVRLYHLSAEQNVSTARFNLGNMYLTGRGVAQDRKKAEQYYMLAASQGNTLALNNLRAMASDVEADDQTLLLYRMASRMHILSAFS